MPVDKRLEEWVKGLSGKIGSRNPANKPDKESFEKLLDGIAELTGEKGLIDKMRREKANPLQGASKQESLLYQEATKLMSEMMFHYEKLVVFVLDEEMAERLIKDLCRTLQETMDAIGFGTKLGTDKTVEMLAASLMVAYKEKHDLARKIAGQAFKALELSELFSLTELRKLKKVWKEVNGDTGKFEKRLREDFLTDEKMWEINNKGHEFDKGFLTYAISYALQTRYKE